jgi:hypothetical protein
MPEQDFVDTALFEHLIHLLELSVVVGIGVIIYITKKYSSRINQRPEFQIDSQLSGGKLPDTETSTKRKE